MQDPQRASASDTTIAAFLADVASHIQRVPADKRETLLREIETHLRALTEELAAGGLNRDEATAAALGKMGPPQSLGRSYTRSWYLSTESGSLLASLGLISLTTKIVYGVNSVVNLIMAHSYDSSTRAVFLAGMFNLPIVLNAAAYGIGGVILGWVTPKTAVKAASIIMAFKAVNNAANLWIYYHAPSNSFRPDLTTPALTDFVAGPILAIAVATATRRLRMRKLASI